jgi:hypothetical protein
MSLKTVKARRGKAAGFRTERGPFPKARSSQNRTVRLGEAVRT